jgi:GNAT superfamily N-acetyltransferase
MPQFTFLHRKNRRLFKELPAVYAQYRQQTVCNHTGEAMPLRVFRRELKRVLRKTDECVWSQNPRAFLVLHEEKKVLGFADIRTVSTDLIETDFAYGTVEDFCIAEAERGKGYGKRLYERTEKVLRDNGTKTVLLTPDPKTGTAFWSKMGYVQTEMTVPGTQSKIYRKDI